MCSVEVRQWHFFFSQNQVCWLKDLTVLPWGVKQQTQTEEQFNITKYLRVISNFQGSASLTCNKLVMWPNLLWWHFVVTFSYPFTIQHISLAVLHHTAVFTCVFRMLRIYNSTGLFHCSCITWNNGIRCKISIILYSLHGPKMNYVLGVWWSVVLRYLSLLTFCDRKSWHTVCLFYWINSGNIGKGEKSYKVFEAKGRGHVSSYAYLSCYSLE